MVIDPPLLNSTQPNIFRCRLTKFRTLSIEATAEGAKTEQDEDEDEDDENLAIKEFYQIPKDFSFLTEGNEQYVM